VGTNVGCSYPVRPSRILSSLTGTSTEVHFSNENKRSVLKCMPLHHAATPPFILLRLLFIDVFGTILGVLTLNIGKFRDVLISFKIDSKMPFMVR
jgi:hypothetical protein